MAHHVEPMDVDSSVCDFDNKENTFHQTNVLPRTPCTEKGYEELDVSELNMKLRYSITPASSPMSKSYTADCLDNKNSEPCDDHVNKNANLTHSLHTTMPKSDSAVKSTKLLPLQALPTDQFLDGNRNALRPLDMAPVDSNITVTISGTNDIDENLSLPSSSSSLTHTPEATTPTKEIQKQDGGSPIMRGLKSVFNMFRPSQSPIPPPEDVSLARQEEFSPPVVHSPPGANAKPETVLSSTPLAAHKTKDVLSKRSSPNRDSLVFNEDLEKELQWKDETTIIFSQEKIPIHKLFFQHGKPLGNINNCKNISEIKKQEEKEEKLDSTVEYMDISYNGADKTMMEMEKATNNSGVNTATESDSEFLDCESFTKNESQTVISFVSQDDLKDEDCLLENKNKHDCEALQLNITRESLSDTLSEKSSNLSTLSTETKTAEPTDNIQLDENNKVDNKKLEEQTNLSKNKQKDLNNGANKITLQEAKNETVIIESINTSMKDCDLVLQSDFATVNEPTNKESYLDNETLGIGSLSQIPLIADPRVLLFNIPQEVINEQTSEETVVVNTTPADIPLPDDEDVEKVLPAELTTKNIENCDESSGINMEINKIDSEINDQICFDSIKSKSREKIAAKVENIYLNTNVSDTTKELDSIISSVIGKQIDDNLVPVTANENKEQDFEKDFSDGVYVNECKNIAATAVNIQLDTKVSNDLVSITPSINEQPINVDVNVNCDEDLVKDVGSVVNNIETCLPREIKGALTIDTDVNVVNANQFITEIGAIPCQELLSVSLDLPKCNEIQAENECITVINNQELDKEIYNVDNVTSYLVSSEEKCFMSEKDISEEVHVLGNTLQVNSKAFSNIEHIIEAVSNDTSKQFEINTIKVNNDIPDQTLLNNPQVTKDNEIKDISSAVVNTNESETMEVSNNVEPMSITDLLNKSADIIAGQETNIIEVVKTYNNNKSDESGTIILPNNKIIADINSMYDTPVSDCIIDEATQHKDTESDNKLTEPKSLINADDLNLNKGNISDCTSMPISLGNTENDELITTHQITINDKIAKEKIIKEEHLLNNLSDETMENIEHKNEVLDEEIIASENNSPFVSVTTELAIEAKPTDYFEENSLEVGTNVSPPSSPKIVSKGYNFNFDEIGDPFATKTKIRMSPPPCSSANQSLELSVDSMRKVDLPIKNFNKNRRKSQPEKKKPATSSKKLSLAANFSVEGAAHKNEIKDSINKKIENKNETSEVLESQTDQEILVNPNNSQQALVNAEILNVTKEIVESVNEPLSGTQKFVEDKPVETNKALCGANNILLDNTNIILSSEQSTNYTDNIEDIKSKNVFNLPEIDDSTFNPFATKTKIRESPPQSLNVTNSLAAECNISNSVEIYDLNCTMNIEPTKLPSQIKQLEFEDKLDSGNIEKDSSDNINNSSCSSKATDDKDLTVREVHTEDEDTIEGVFLEAEDLNDDNMSAFNTTNINMADLPSKEIDDNTEAGELFIDAEAFEFLLNQNKANVVTDSGKESLFLKFDPLFAKRMSSDGVVAALGKVQKRQSTPKKNIKSQADATFVKNTPVAGTSLLNQNYEIDISNVEVSSEDFNVTVSKPMMVVTPAVNAIVTTRNKNITPPQANRRSLTFTSPAIAVIDRLLSLSANNSFADHDNTVAEVVREPSEADLALTQLRELLADKEISVYNLRSESKELKERLATLESQVKSLESISEERLKKINELNEKLSEKTRINKNMATVVEEYERTIASLIAETEQDKKRHADERMQLIKERDEQTAHLASMEVSFSDLHSKYEKSKQVILSFKSNEETYRQSNKEFEENLSKMQTNYELLKQHATSKLNHANEELQKMNRAHEAEVLKLNAMMKRKELHITSLEETLLQKTKANEKLTAICDELISKVG